MNPSNATPAEFYFELSANGENTTFESVEGLSTEVVLRNNLVAGENPFKFRLPSMPKTGNLVLHKGKSPQNSKLMQWTAEAANPEVPTPKSNATLCLKDTSGKALVEWTLHSAHPTHHKATAATEKDAAGTLEDFGLKYSFFTLNKK